jgi:uncharacterized protein (DUF302 family)
MKNLIAAAALSLMGTAPALAELITVPTEKSVAVAMDALEAAVTAAGATVFARIDHQAGAQSVDMEMPAAQTLIFGNPLLGTPAMQDDIRASLMLPLKVAIYEGQMGTIITYEDPAEMFDGFAISPGTKYVKTMTNALANLTEAAAN